MWERRCQSSPNLRRRQVTIDAAQPILYSFRRCPYAIRARLALAASGQTCEHREVVLSNKPPELLAASPKGTVPVLVLPGGGVIDESLDIMLWALHHHDPQQWLGQHNDSLDDSLRLIAQCDGPFKMHLDAYKYATANPTALQARGQASVFIGALNKRLAGNAYLYLCGAQLSLTDAAIMPFVRQFAAVQPGWFAQQGQWQGVQTWLARITTSTLFSSVMQKQPPWQKREQVRTGNRFYINS